MTHATEKPFMRTHAIDAVNGTTVGAFLLATLQGWTIQDWTALFGLLYVILLVLDKLGALAPVRRLFLRWAAWSWRQIIAAGRIARGAREP